MSMGSYMLIALGLTMIQGAGVPEFRDDKPIDISAERCEIFDNQDTWQCEGSVRVAQGDAILSAGKMTIFGTKSENGFSRIEAFGSVRYASGVNAMSGNAATYDAANTTLTLTGDVVVVEGEQIMTGGRLVYNTTTGATVFTPPPSGRVRGVFFPGKNGL